LNARAEERTQRAAHVKEAIDLKCGKGLGDRVFTQPEAANAPAFGASRL
jgi:hypothetical protein